MKNINSARLPIADYSSAKTIAAGNYNISLEHPNAIHDTHVY